MSDDEMLLAAACATQGESQRERACGEALGAALEREAGLLDRLDAARSIVDEIDPATFAPEADTERLDRLRRALGVGENRCVNCGKPMSEHGPMANCSARPDTARLLHPEPGAGENRDDYEDHGSYIVDTVGENPPRAATDLVNLHAAYRQSEALLRQVQEIHADNGHGWCQGCGFVPGGGWVEHAPCRTSRLLSGVGPPERTP